MKVIEHEHVKPAQTGKYWNMEKKRTKIIFVCHGNICRSPMAEFIFRQMVKEEGRENEFAISSAAVSYEEEGNGIYPHAADTLRKHGIPYGRHLAHRISKEEYEEADLVIVMDSSNLRLMGRISENCDKVHKLLEYADAENASNTSSNSEANEGKTSESNKGKHPVSNHSNLPVSDESKRSELNASKHSVVTSNIIPDVADPWYTGNFEKAYSDILRGCRGLLKTL